VYRATCPLEGWEAAAEALGELYPSQLHLHTFVVLEAFGPRLGGSGSASERDSVASDAGQPSIVAYDFLPSQPTSPVTAAVLLAGGSVPGKRGCCCWPMAARGTATNQRVKSLSFC
jgi:hypothetical protein